MKYPHKGDIRRLVTTIDSNGDVVLTSYNVIVSEHECDLQPLSGKDFIALNARQITATHKVFPKTNVVPSCEYGDFYFIDGQKYSIVEKFDFDDSGYFRVLFDDSGNVGTTESHQLFFEITGVTPGSYTFGSGIFSHVPTFSSAPVVIGTKTNDSDYYIENITTTGFDLVDRGLGDSPVVNVQIWERPDTASQDTIYFVSGVGPGNHVYGSGLFANIGAFSTAPVVFFEKNNDSDFYITNQSETGFTVVDRGLGSPPDLTVMIIRR